MQIRPYERKANYYETDQMGIIHHSNYIRWFEETRVDFMEQVNFGYDKVVEAGLDFALLGLSCQYKNMVRFGDTVEITTTVGSITPSRMSLSYTVINKETGLVCATGHTDHCYFDNRKQRPVSLKKALPELYQLFCTLDAQQA